MLRDESGSVFHAHAKPGFFSANESARGKFRAELAASSANESARRKDRTEFGVSSANERACRQVIHVEGRSWQPCDSVVKRALLEVAGTRSPRVTYTDHLVGPTTTGVDGHVGLAVASDWCSDQLSMHVTARMQFAAADLVNKAGNPIRKKRQNKS